MTPGNQSQKAGQGSQQIQVAGDLIMGIDEGRAKEIAVVTARQVIAEFTDEALATVRTRIDELDERVIRTLTETDQLGAFADPGFQRAIKKAQNSAAASDRAMDYDMLAALLSDRAAKPKDRRVLSAIERSIEIIDQVDDDALRALTILMSVPKWSPTSGFINEGLDLIEKVFAQLVDGPLPTGGEWAEHLDIVDAVRVSSTSEFKKFDDLLAERLNGYAAAGVLKGEAPDFVGGNFPEVSWAGVLTDHELRPGYVRLATPSAAALRKSLEKQGLAEELITEMMTTAESLFGVGVGRGTEESIAAFKEALRARPVLARIGEWWDQIPGYVRATAVGRTLAIANAFRLDVSNELPREE
ncbi:hypothetical protein OYT00_06745 [Microbacterium paraoxydans]|uniref:LPO_1073/Vpar_1526 family protein n=1 Tax=Microbacterium paraoxydans TaxID=199592 RepID=UPI002285460C|nr:LPO_1073/Vpar_1526 family protein [Microbacterium paraoxydans]MCZ0709688.1 hypothetical protein [Microbacterium paraoxydans]